MKEDCWHTTRPTILMLLKSYPGLTHEESRECIITLVSHVRKSKIKWLETKLGRSLLKEEESWI